LRVEDLLVGPDESGARHTPLYLCGVDARARYGFRRLEALLRNTLQPLAIGWSFGLDKGRSLIRQTLSFLFGPCKREQGGDKVAMVGVATEASDAPLQESANERIAVTLVDLNHRAIRMGEETAAKGRTVKKRAQAAKLEAAQRARELQRAAAEAKTDALGDARGPDAKAAKKQASPKKAAEPTAAFVKAQEAQRVEQARKQRKAAQAKTKQERLETAKQAGGGQVMQGMASHTASRQHSSSIEMAQMGPVMDD